MEIKTFLKKLNATKDLPTLPTIAVEINRMVDDSNTTIESISETIAKDQAITSKMLKLVNSAFFGLPSKVSNISEAVILLGFSAVRNVVLSVSLIKTFPGRKSPEKYDIKTLWRHSVAVAIISRYLSEQSHRQEPEECFVGGLLHDMGKVIIALYLKDDFSDIIRKMKDEHLSFNQAEKDILPINHAKIGAFLAKKWKLPQNLIDVIQYHHTPGAATHHTELVYIIHTANIVAETLMDDPMKIEYGGINLKLSKINPKAVKILKPQLITISEWFPELVEAIQEGCKFFIDEVNDE